MKVYDPEKGVMVNGWRIGNERHINAVGGSIARGSQRQRPANGKLPKIGPNIRGGGGGGGALLSSS